MIVNCDRLIDDLSFVRTRTQDHLRSQASGQSRSARVLPDPQTTLGSATQECEDVDLWNDDPESLQLSR